MVFRWPCWPDTMKEGEEERCGRSALLSLLTQDKVSYFKQVPLYASAIIVPTCFLAP